MEISIYYIYVNKISLLIKSLITQQINHEEEEEIIRRRSDENLQNKNCK